MLQTPFHIKRLFLALSLLLTFSLSAAPTTTLARPASGAPASAAVFSRQDREDIFEKVWSTINATYYDPKFNGVDWKAVGDRYRPLVLAADTDEKFFAVLKRMVGELHDAHTRVLTPSERERWETYKSTSVGVQAFEVEGKAAIVKVDEGSEAEAAGVRPGMIVLDVDGKSVDTVFNDLRPMAEGTSSERAALLRLYGWLFSGEPGSKVTVRFQKPEGGEITASLTRQIVTNRPRIAYSQLPSGIGYIQITAWEAIDEDFRAAVSKLSSATGLIIDLRGNRGGRVAQVLRCAEYLLPSKTDFGQFVARSGKVMRMVTNPGRQIYSGPIVILTDEASASGSEFFAGVLQETGRATVIGRQSCGCMLAITNRRKLKGGIGLHISELGYVSPKGRTIEGAGVLPDQIIKPTIAALVAGEDLPFEAAERLLQTRASQRAEARMGE